MLEKHFLISSLSHDFAAERESSAVLDGGKGLFSAVMFPVSVCGCCYLGACTVVWQRTTEEYLSKCGARPVVSDCE